MKKLKTAVAVAALPLGIVLSGLLYAYNEDGNVRDWALWWQLAVAALTATVWFVITRSTWPGLLRGMVVGAVFTYITWVVLLMAADPRDLMWLPVMVLFGIPLTAPIVVGAWLVSGVFLSLYEEPNKVL